MRRLPLHGITLLWSAKLRPADRLRLFTGLVWATGEFLGRLPFVGLRRPWRALVVTALGGRVFETRLGPFRLWLTVEEMLQEMHVPERESHIGFHRFVQTGDVACDVGAHIGTHTLRLAALVGVRGRVVALEPCAHNYALLQRNMAGNGFADRVQMLRAALAPRAGRVKLYNLGSSMYFSLVRESDDFEEVDAITFADLFAALGRDRIEFMKVDIEGAEADLLLSEYATFERARIGIMYVDPHAGVDYPEIVAHLAGFGYRHRRLAAGHLFYASDRAADVETQLGHA